MYWVLATRIMLHKSLNVFRWPRAFRGFGWTTLCNAPEGVVRQNAATKSQAGHMSGTKVALCVRSQALGWGKNTSAALTYSCFNILGKACGLKLYLSLASLLFMTILFAMKIIPLTERNPLTKRYFKAFWKECFIQNDTNYLASYHRERKLLVSKWISILAKECTKCGSLSLVSNLRSNLICAAFVIFKVLDSSNDLAWQPNFELLESVDICKSIKLSRQKS